MSEVISDALRVSGLLSFLFSFVYSFVIHSKKHYQETTICNMLIIALGSTKMRWLKLYAERAFVDLLEKTDVSDMFPCSSKSVTCLLYSVL